MDSGQYGEQILCIKLMDFIPLVRYVPINSPTGTDDEDWEESDLADVRLEEHNSRCYFCLEDFKPPRRKSVQGSPPSDNATEPLRQYPCGHVSHQYCADHWMRENTACFLCKKKLYPAEALRDYDHWSGLFNLTRGGDGVVRKVVDVELVQSHELTGDNVYYTWFSADGRFIALGCNETTFRIWKDPTASEVVTHDLGIVCSSCCVDKDASVIFTGHQDGSLRMWNIDDQHDEDTAIRHRDNVRDLVMSGDGRLVASVSDDKMMRIWEKTDDSLVRTIKLHAKPLALVCLSMDGNFGAVALVNGEVLVCATKTGVTLRCLDAHSGSSCGIIFTPDGAGMLTGDENGTLKYWDTGSVFAQKEHMGGSVRSISRIFRSHIRLRKPDKIRAPVRSFSRHTSGITVIDVSPDGRWVASCSTDGELYIWDIRTAELECTLQAHGTRHITSVEFSRKEPLLGTCDTDGNFRIWRYTTYEDAQQTSLLRISASRGNSRPPTDLQSVLTGSSGGTSDQFHGEAEPADAAPVRPSVETKDNPQLLHLDAVDSSTMQSPSSTDEIALLSTSSQPISNSSRLQPTAEEARVRTRSRARIQRLISSTFAG